MTELVNCTGQTFPQLCGVSITVDPRRQIVPTRDCILLVSQMDDSATAQPYTIEPVIEDTRTALFGSASMINIQTDFIRGIRVHPQLGPSVSDPNVPIFAYTVPNDFGTPGTSDITMPDYSTGTTSGTQSLWLNGELYSVAYTPMTDAAALAAAFAAQINARDPDRYIATAAAGVLTIETILHGEIGGWLDVRDYNEAFPQYRNDLPATISVTPGTGTPDLSGLPDEAQCCAQISNPYSDSASMSAVKAKVCKSWGGSGVKAANSRSRARMYTYFTGDRADSAALARACNYAGASPGGGGSEVPTPPWIATASMTLMAYRCLNKQAPNIAGNMTGKALPNVMPPAAGMGWSEEAMALLADAGFSSFCPNGANGMIFGTALTSFRTNDNGTASEDYWFMNDPALDSVVADTFERGIHEKYILGGYSFRADGVVGARCAGRVATVDMVRNYLVNLAQRSSQCNHIQDIDGFIQALEITISEEGCLDIDGPTQRVRPFCCARMNLRVGNTPVLATAA